MGPNDSRSHRLSISDSDGSQLHRTDSHALDDRAVSLLCGLRRRSEDPPDRVPGDPRRSSLRNRIDDLSLAPSAVQSSSLKEILLDRALIGFVGFVVFETPRQLIAVVENVLD